MKIFYIIPIISNLFIFIILLFSLLMIILLKIVLFFNKIFNNKSFFNQLFNFVIKAVDSIQKIQKKLVRPFYYSIYINGVYATYIVSEIFIRIPLTYFNINSNVITYLQTCSLLAFFLYFPNEFGLLLSKMLNKLLDSLFFNNSIEFNNINNFINKFFDEVKNAISFLKPRIYVYFLSFIFTLLASIEKISNSNLINFSQWIAIKPVIIESVLTIIVLDAFINEYKKK